MIIKSFEIQKKEEVVKKYNLFLLYGENVGLKKDLRELIKKIITKNESNVDFFSFYENEIIENAENFYNSIYSGSLFSDKTIITINSSSDKIINQINSVIEQCPKKVILFLFADILEKKSKLRYAFEKNEKTLCIPCYSDNEKNLGILTANELKKNNISLSREAINLLVEKANSDRINLKNELEKIKSYALNKKNITLDEVRFLINFAGEYKSDTLVNECLCGNISNYKKIISELYVDTINYIFLFRILSNKILRLINLKKDSFQNKNIDNLLAVSKPPIFWQEKSLVKKQLSVWKLNELKEILNQINDMELMCKKNPKISNLIFFNFFNKICTKANNFS